LYKVNWGALLPVDAAMMSCCVDNFSIFSAKVIRSSVDRFTYSTELRENLVLLSINCYAYLIITQLWTLETGQDR